MNEVIEKWLGWGGEGGGGTTVVLGATVDVDGVLQMKIFVKFQITFLARNVSNYFNFGESHFNLRISLRRELKTDDISYSQNYSRLNCSR